MIQQEIINLVLARSGGAVKLSHHTATETIDLVLHQAKTAYVQLFRFVPGRKTWEPSRKIATTDQRINQEIIAALDNAPDQERCFYKFECYNSDGLLDGTIYSVNPALFG